MNFYFRCNIGAINIQTIINIHRKLHGKILVCNWAPYNSWKICTYWLKYIDPCAKKTKIKWMEITQIIQHSHGDWNVMYPDIKFCVSSRVFKFEIVKYTSFLFFSSSHLILFKSQFGNFLSEAWDLSIFFLN